MLSCKVGVSNVNVVDYNEKQLRSWSKRGLLKCPVCGEKLIYKHGLVRIPHFSHEKDKECTYTYFENETKEHASGKVLLYKLLKSNKNILNLELEVYIPETKQRPDLYFEFNGLKYVIEYQCTPLLLSEFKERRELYKLAGIIDIWIFGYEKYSYSEKGKLKLKTSEENWWLNHQRIYFLNPYNETLYKFYRIYDYEYSFPFIKIDLTKNVEFYLYDYEIIFNGLEYKNSDKDKIPIEDCKRKEMQNYKFIITNNLKDTQETFNPVLNINISNNPINLFEIYKEFSKLTFKEENIIITYLTHHKGVLERLGDILRINNIKNEVKYTSFRMEDNKFGAC